MASVDDRIVRMEFDNAAFERKLNTTLTSLGQLDKALKFTGATKGLNDVSAAASKVDVSTISNGIENVSKGFIALSTIAITTLASITTSAIAAGTQLIKAFAIKPVLDGFREYETNMNSIQTILANTASKGTTLDQVSEALQRLNEYSDQTIYNFGQMAKNIGTFTAAGVDLETSVGSIKGIANLAAMSGSSAEQASGAMYQLSQAIATGSLKLIDWNSVVNAGMGGEAFKSALFETGKAMHTITDVPLDMTFKQWEDAGNSFRETLQDGWITADVLTTTLQGFTGDMTEEMLLQKGFSEAQAANILKTAAIAKAAATEVKTFTQLIGTVKEAVGTGFADSFKIIIGNFNEAKVLFTSLNNTIGAFVNKTADARNELLQGWKDLGGRTLLIDSLKEAFHNLGLVLAPIKEAFTNIFPPLTSERLFEMTQAFSNFIHALTPSAETIDKIRRVFQGLFAILSIGWEILKEGARFIATLAKELLGLVTPGASDFLAKLGDGLVNLQKALVVGGGIKAFFAGLGKVLEKPLALLGKVRDALGAVFGIFNEDTADAVGESMGRLGDRFESVKAIFEKVSEFIEPLERFFEKVKEIFIKVKDAVFEFFGNLGQELAKVMNKGNFDMALDAINTGLLAGITLLIAKFLKSGFNIDIKSVFSLGGGLVDQIRGTFGELTNTLKAMQTQIKANALLKIAAAIGILTASVLVLSMIDSEALTKALAAMAIGFAELMGSFAIFTKLAADPKSAATFTIMSTGLILLSTALLILTGAVRLMAGLSWDELARGLAGITGILGLLVVSTKPLAANSKGMVVAGVGITAMAVGLTIMGGAMKIFASMSWEEMAKGLVAVGALLLGIAGAMHLMPPGPMLLAQGLALIGIAFALNILAGALLIFGTMNWETMGKGMVGLAGALLIIAGAMHLMPGPAMILSAAGLILVGIALTEIAGVMKILATMSWDEIARGLVVLAGALAIIAGAMYLMSGALPGAAALLVVSFALGVLAAVLKVFGKIDFEDLLVSLGQLALALGVIAGVSLLLAKTTPFILALGIALMSLGAGFALFGLGVMLVGKGLESIAKSGKKAAETLDDLLIALGEAMPALAIGLANGIVELVKVLGASAPVFAEAIGKLLGSLLIELEKLIPKLGPVLVLLIKEIIRVIKSYVQEYISLGWFVIRKFLDGIENNIGPITESVGNIITNFLTEMDKQIPRIAEALKNTIITALTEAARLLGEVAATILFGVGMAFIEGFFEGVKRAFAPVLAFFGGILEDLWEEIKGAGTFLLGIGEKIIDGLWEGMKNIWREVKDWLGNIAEKIGNIFESVLSIFSPSRVMMRIGRYTMEGLSVGMQDEWDHVESWLESLDPAKTLAQTLNALSDQMSNMDDFNPTITPVLDLTQVARDAALISDYIHASSVTPAFSYAQANTIASEQRVRTEDAPNSQNGIEAGVKFEQNIYAPTQLSTSDIYKNTRNQIMIAKEELSIP